MIVECSLRSIPIRSAIKNPHHIRYICAALGWTRRSVSNTVEVSLCLAASQLSRDHLSSLSAGEDPRVVPWPWISAAKTWICMLQLTVNVDSKRHNIGNSKNLDFRINMDLSDTKFNEQKRGCKWQ